MNNITYIDVFLNDVKTKVDRSLVPVDNTGRQIEFLLNDKDTETGLYKIDTVNYQKDLDYKVLIKANRSYEKEVAKLTAGVPQSEVQTWTKQETEARAFQIDPTAKTPLIDALSSSRGVSKEYLVDKIIEKADAYAAAIGALTGTRQKVEDENPI